MRSTWPLSVQKKPPIDWKKGLGRIMMSFLILVAFGLGVVIFQLSGSRCKVRSASQKSAYTFGGATSERKGPAA